MIGLVDGNNFYVSCERIFDPALEGKPVAVLSNNDGCVISRSPECKALGIPMGTPGFQLKPRLARDGLVVKSSNYELYGDLSRRLIAVLGEFSPDVEQYSIDEAFIQLNPPAGTDGEACARELRRTLLQWLGLPCGIGLAPSRTLAKIANHIAKKQPSGVFVLPADPRPVLEALPVAEVWGVGRRLAPKLNALGIRNAWQLATADELFLRKRFNVTLAQTALELRGRPVFERENPEDPARSLSCSRSFGRPVTALEELREALAHYTARAAERLRRQGLRAAGANLYIQSYPESAPPLPGGVHAATVSFATPCAETSELLRELLPKLRGLFQPGRRYKKAGVMFFGLEPDCARQPDLFADQARQERNDRFAAAVDAINQRYGRNTVFPLAEGIRKPWAMRREWLSPSYTTRWDQLVTVK